MAETATVVEVWLNVDGSTLHVYEDGTGRVLPQHGNSGSFASIENMALVRTLPAFWRRVR